MSACPQCDATIDAYTHVDRALTAPPCAGDVGMCIECGQLLVYEAGWTVRAPTDEDILGWPADLRAMLLRMTTAHAGMKARAK